MRPLACTLLALSTGCASVLSTMQPATVVPSGHFHIATAIEGSLPVGGVARMIDQAKTTSSNLSQNGGTLTDQQRNQMLDGTVGLMLDPPTVGTEFQLGYGFLGRLEADLRYALASWRLGGRLQFLGDPVQPGFSGTLGVGFSRYQYELNIPDIIDQFVDVKDFTRYEVDIPVLFGWSSRSLHFWFGPKLILTWFETGVSACIDYDLNARQCTRTVGASFSGNSQFFGAQVGVAVGYKYAWVALELTLAGMRARGTGKIFDGTTEISHEFQPDADLVTYPALGLLLRL